MGKHTKVNNQWFQGIRENQVSFLRHSYENCSFDDGTFQECCWSDGKFIAVRFREVQFLSCMFEDCKFVGQNTYLGPSLFRGCTFVRCVFKDVQPWKAAFEACRLVKTVLDNVSFYGHPDNLRTTFRDVDMREARFTFTGFSAGVDLSSVRLPAEGIRIFRNPKNELGRRLFEASGADNGIPDMQERLSKCRRRAIYMLGDDGTSPVFQDPLVLDDDFLASLLVGEEDRTLFEDLARSFETKR